MTIMESNVHPKTHQLIQRIFIAQCAMIGFATVLVLSATKFDIGFFWFAFLGGMFGASLALLRRVQLGNSVLVERAAMSWYTTLMPFLYGGMMAAVTYFLFISGILSGQDGTGLLATNLFPDFGPPKLPGSNGSEVAVTAKQAAVEEWLVLRPTELSDAGKLMIWCFLGGYSESFVTGILGRLESNG